jgi:hypothetical protein
MVGEERNQGEGYFAAKNKNNKNTKLLHLLIYGLI